MWYRVSVKMLFIEKKQLISISQQNLLCVCVRRCWCWIISENSPL